MTDRITTKTVGRDFAEVEEDFLLEETSNTRIVFRAQLHPGGIRGKIVRIKRTSGDTWEEERSHDFRKLSEGEGGRIELSTEGFNKFIDAFEKLKSLLEQQGIHYGRTQYVAAPAEQVVVTESNKAHYIKELLEKGYSEEIWKSIVEKDPDLATKISLSRIYYERKKIVDEFKEKLSSDEDEEYWQKLLAENKWLFGNSYIGRVGERRINISSTVDHPLIAEDGSLEIIEIKKPSFPFWVIARDGNNFLYRNKYRVPNRELEYAITQARNYIFETEKEIDSRSWAEDHDGIFPLKPRGLIVFGRSNTWNDEDICAFRLLNDSLHGVTVITFDHLLSRAEQIIKLFNPDGEE